MFQRFQQVVGWSPPTTRINFQVTAKLDFGESLFIVGTLPLFGNSLSPENGEGIVTLVTTPEFYPIWYNAYPMEVRASTLLYRYGVVCEGKIVRYENVEKRSVVIKGHDIMVSDTIDKISTEVMQRIPQVPRLKSGQAIVDRFEEGGSVRRGRRRMSASSPLSKSSNRIRGIASISSPMAINSSNTMTIPEDEVATSTEAENSIPLSPLSISSSVGAGRAKRPRSNSEDRREGHIPVTIEKNDGVIIVAKHLPLRVLKTEMGWRISWNEEHFLCPATAHFGRPMSPNFGTETARITWIGQLQDACEEWTKKDKEDLVKELTKFRCVPVFLTNNREEFEHYSNTTLWPVFHNIVGVYGQLPTRWWNPNQQKHVWRSYKDANRHFVQKVIEVYNEGDLVWVHGIDLLLVPSFLSRRLPYANVGLFLHAPFPSSEIFRSLSVREELLRGMLSADHIGFHLYEYARHFLTSCRRILGVKFSGHSGGYLGIEYSGRTVALTISHIGIEPKSVQTYFNDMSVQDQVSALKEEYTKKGELVIVSCDALERLKGIPLKLKALERFLMKFPEYISKVKLIQLCITPEQENVYTKGGREEILEIVTRINTTFGKQVVIFLERSCTSLQDRLPYWLLGDIMLVTSIRDAVNTYPFEFVYAQELCGKKGLVILSEFTGSSRVLTGGFGINPWKINEIVHALHVAITSPETEKAARHRKNMEYVTQNTRTVWAERMLIDLKRVRRRKTDGECMGYGLGLGFRMMEFNAGFKQLDVDELAKNYRTSFRRIMFFDYGNTLVSALTRNKGYNYMPHSSALQHEMVPPPEKVLTLLETLCQDPRNTVFVLSGRDKEEMDEVLGTVPRLGLVAEHGYFYRWGADQKEEWLCTKDNFDDSWKDLTHSVMDIYTQRTHGTYIEVKGSALLWQFRDADIEFGQLQSKELQDQLTQVLSNFPVAVLMGDDYIEVRPEGVDKGSIVDRIISTMETVNDTFVDFVLCIGDDKSDESMFAYLENNCHQPKLYTCTVGKKPSAAKYFINDVDGVMEVISSMTKVSTTANRNLSMNDLRHFDENYNMSKESKPEEGNNTTTRNHKLKSKNSISMGSMHISGGMTTSASSTTLEQYFNNFEEDDGSGGIFF